LSFLLLPRAEAPASGFSFLFSSASVLTSFLLFFYFVSLAKLLSASPKSHLFPFCFNLSSLSFPLCFLSLLLFCFCIYPCFFSLVLLLSALFSFSPLDLLLSLFFLSFLFFSSLFPSSSFFYLPSVPLFFLSFSLLCFSPLFFPFFPLLWFFSSSSPPCFFSSSPLACSVSPSGFYSQNYMLFFSDNEDVWDQYCSGNGW